MRFKRHIELEYGLRQIDIVAIIDIVLLLVIFLLLTSNFVMQPGGIKVSLPKAITLDMVRRENMEIVVSADSLIYINDKVISIQDLKNLLTQTVKRNQPILIKADKKASLGKVVEIWNLARDLGAIQINIATN